jgi:ketosteroid isomerase-like protein
MRKFVYLAAAILVLLCITAGALHLRAQAQSAVDEKAAIQALYNDWNDAFLKKDVNTIMSFYAPGVFAFDVVPPREYPTWNAYKKDWQDFFTAFPGPVANSLSEVNITVVGSVAYTRCIDDGTLTGKDGSKMHMVVRVTDVLRKSNGKWRIVQEHVSVPVDLSTGKADLLSKP